MKKSKVLFPISHPWSSMLRVDHAGECAAVGICEGQRYIFAKCNNMHGVNNVDAMAKQEQEHRAFFQQQLVQHGVASTAFLPIWNKCSQALGVLSALLGYKASMICVEAVEIVIVRHYNRQIKILEAMSPPEGISPKEFSLFITTIKRFRDEEEEHHNIAKKTTHDEEKKSHHPLEKFFGTAISVACSCAILLSERI